MADVNHCSCPKANEPCRSAVHYADILGYLVLLLFSLTLFTLLGKASSSCDRETVTAQSGNTRPPAAAGKAPLPRYCTYAKP